MGVFTVYVTLYKGATGPTHTFKPPTTFLLWFPLVFFFSGNIYETDLSPYCKLPDGTRTIIRSSNYCKNGSILLARSLFRQQGWVQFLPICQRIKKKPDVCTALFQDVGYTARIITKTCAGSIFWPRHPVGSALQPKVGGLPPLHHTAFTLKTANK